MLAVILFATLSSVQAAVSPPVDAESPAVEAEAPAVAADAPKPSRQRLICRSRPRLGTRLVAQRVCKTAEEWVIYEGDLEQSRRDINDRGMRGGGSTIF